MMEPSGDEIKSQDETVDRKKKERTKLVLSPPLRPPNTFGFAVFFIKSSLVIIESFKFGELMIPSFIKWFTPSFCSQYAYTQIGDETKQKNWDYRIKLGPKDSVCDF
jgi:hypothetical protein